MSSFYQDDFTLSLIVGLLAALLLAVGGFLLGKLTRDSFYRRHFRRAPGKYLSQLTGLIDKAVDEGPKNAIVNARAIVSARNDIRRNMVIMHSYFNSEFTILAARLSDDIDAHLGAEEELLQFTTRNPRPYAKLTKDTISNTSASQKLVSNKNLVEQESSKSIELQKLLYDDFCVLQKKWPIKKLQIEAAMKRFIAELGFDPK